MALTTSRSQFVGRIFFLGFIVLVYIFLLTPLVVVVIAARMVAPTKILQIRRNL